MRIHLLQPRTPDVCGKRHPLIFSSTLAAVVMACAMPPSAVAAEEGGQEMTSPGNTKPGKTQQELMAERGFVRYRGAWRTVQEIELIERAERKNLAQKEWNLRLERLRKQVDQPAHADRAAEEIREIADPFAVPSIAAALGRETVFRVRSLYVEALSRIRSSEAMAALALAAIDHPDPETRIIAAERLVSIGPYPAVPGLVAALSGPDNARINRAAEALGRICGGAAGGTATESVVGSLVDALETEHMVVVGDGTPEGSTTATFTPNNGGLSVGGGAKRMKKRVRNERVLEALVTITGMNFEWDAAAWRSWLASRESPPDYDPRRG
jgi:hypothetical protein